MAIYFMKVQVISRAKGSTSTGSSAYRAGELVRDERTGLTFDYSRRRGEIETEILAPAGAPAWVHDRERLWNAVEMGEKRCDAQLAREMVVAFPIELNPDQQRELIRGYAQEQFVSLGIVADVAIHRNPGNPHAHIMLTMREMTPDGFAAKKNREWNRPEMLERWRAQWATHANRALERAGRDERIDHRSLVAQGADRLPQVHLGPESSVLERRGIATEKGDHNRMVAEHNAVVVDLEKAREEKKRIETAKVVSDRHDNRMQKGWTREQSMALGHLEFGRGGQALTAQAVDAIGMQASNERSDIKQQIKAIDDEGRRLELAARGLEKRQQAGEKLERLNGPVPTVRRWFREEARREFREAHYAFASEDNNVKVLGTTSDAELQQQRVKWERDVAGIPALEQRVDVLKQTLEWAAKALDGFVRAYEREEPDWLMRSERRPRDKDRDRGMDRGR